MNVFELNSQETMLEALRNSPEHTYDANRVQVDWEKGGYQQGFPERFDEAKPSFFIRNDAPARLLYVAIESQKFGNMDQKERLNRSDIFIFEGRGYNNSEAGNIVWGAVMAYCYFPLNFSLDRANDYTRFMYGKEDPANEQNAIKAGWEYYNNK